MTDAQDIRARLTGALEAAADRAYRAASGVIEEDATAAQSRWRVLVDRRVGITAAVVLAAAVATVAYLPDVIAAGGSHAGIQGAGTPQEGSLNAALSNGDASGDSQTQAPAALATVHVVGAVASPGVYQVPASARVQDAVEAAGGATEGAQLDALNLARRVSDGEQIRVPAEGEAVVADGGKINVNTADAASLEDLPGVGPVLAGRIVQFRTEHGPFVTLDDLGQVSGVGPSVLEQVRDAATV